MDLKVSSRRAMAAYGRGQADRIPVASPISWGAGGDIDRDRPGGWRADPGFIRLARLVQQHCDALPPYNTVSLPNGLFSRTVSYQRFCEASDEFIEMLPPQKTSAIRTRHAAILHTPKGDLNYAHDVDDGIETTWDMIKPINCPADVEKMLSVPNRFTPPPAADFEPFRAYRREMGDDCIGGAGVNCMVAMLCAMMPYQLLLEWTATEPGLLRHLADAWLERTWQRVECMLANGVGPFWHFNGVERATPPMMGPRQWAEWVEPYDGEIMHRIKAADPNALIHVHCHGRVATVLNSFMAMGVDSTDPVEPPPQGDIEFAEARRRVGERMTLYGNIEFVDMETREPDEIERKVRQAIEQSGRSRTVLYLSATPHERHTARQLANAERYIEAAVKFGRR
jgi:uroporphyrinogen-III decarboxylase